MRLLVVDDDPAVRALIADALEECGHSVVTATSGAEALIAFQKEIFRLVITDWQMPEMDGPALCRAIRTSRSPGHTYIIVLTGMQGADNVVSGLDAGADDYLTKPFAPEELRASGSWPLNRAISCCVHWPNWSSSATTRPASTSSGCSITRGCSRSTSAISAAIRRSPRVMSSY